MRLIPNEVAYAQKCLKYDKIDKGTPYRSVRVIILYFHFIHQMTREDILDNVWLYVQRCGMEHKIDYDYLKTEYINKVIQTTNEMKRVDFVTITKNELDTIMNNNYPHSYRKVLFVMLVMFKAKYKINGLFNCKIDASEIEIIKDAHATMSKDKRKAMWKSFVQDGYVTLSEYRKASETILHYVDSSNKEVAIEVFDFDDYYMFFEQYKKGGRLKYCEVCGDLVLTKGNRTKYCKPCSKRVNIEKTNAKC